MKNPLALPLLIVSLVAGVEAVALVILLSRQPKPAPAVQAASAAQAPAERAATGPVAAPLVPPVSTEASEPSEGVARGKKGQRVESAGFGITVEEITSEATYPNLLSLGPDQRYRALLVLVENNTGGNVGLYPAQFRLQDEKGFEYERGLPLKQPTLEWRTMGNRESVRGYIDFVVPKSAKGLKLIYSHLPAKGSKPIHVELGD